MAFDGKVESNKQFLLFQTRPEIALDQNFPPKYYDLKIYLIDEITGKTNTIQRAVKLEKFLWEDTIRNSNDLDDWMFKYYQKPKPEKMFSAFVYFLRQMDFENEAGYGNAMYFFKEVLNNSPFLLSHLVKAYGQETDKDIKDNLFLLIGYSNCSIEQYKHLFRAEEMIRFEEIRNNPLVEPFDGAIEHPQTLDFLWCRFFANGRFENIEKITEALEYGIPTQYKSIPQQDVSLQQAIYQAAKWSLKSNAETHEFVKIYSIYLLENRELHSSVRRDLADVIQ